MTPWTVAHHPFLQGSYILIGSFPGGSDGKESVCNARDVGLIPGLGRSSRSPGEGNGNPLQYSWRTPWTEEPGGPQFRVAKSGT